MARKPRFAPGGIAYHVMNRAAAGIDLFHHDPDYAAFERTLAQAVGREPSIRLCAYCFMPNHFHLVLWPTDDGELSRFMQWLTMTHTQRWHAHRHTGGRGHLYQSRFKSFPIQTDRHFLSVCRYVERNPLRANLVKQAQRWRWSSLWLRENNTPEKRGHKPLIVPTSDSVTPATPPPLANLLAPWPLPIPRDWITRVNQPENEKELAALRTATDRGRPYGDPDWTTRTAHALHIQSSLRPPGRPKKQKQTAKPRKPGKPG